MLQDGVRTSPLCASPVTVGFFHPMVIFPENWREWEPSRVDAILTHEEEHVRRHSRDKAREIILQQWQGKEYSDINELADKVVAAGVCSYFHDRGYFKASAHDPATQLLGVRNGKQQVLVSVTVAPGEEYRLGTLSFRSAEADHVLSIPAASLREQFNSRQSEVFNVAELRAGLQKS